MAVTVVAASAVAFRSIRNGITSNHRSSNVLLVLLLGGKCLPRR